MQFIPGGPDVPERLLQDHEDGRVVFFCGAGISVPAGLPGFAGLVEKIYEGLCEEPNAVEQAAIDAEQYDTAIGLFEARLVDGRKIVRRELANILKLQVKENASHKALLTLAKNSEGGIRLITTNFDRLFEEAIVEAEPPVKRFLAPHLPVRESSWEGLVYLHGLLSDPPKQDKLDDLILSSGDFGLAYLQEGWAAHFVTKLFRNYTVCFVGYSINDPILRYMVDALAAARLLGESPPEMFAFGDYKEGKQAECEQEWLAKNVMPIPYRGDQGHIALHDTLREWSEVYRDGVFGKERIVHDCVENGFPETNKKDYVLGRLRWAIKDSSGLPAKKFAEFDPVPSLDWLKHLESFLAVDSRDNRYEKVAKQIKHWLIRHLDDHNFLIWLINQESQLREEMFFLIRNQLYKLTMLKRDNEEEKLDRIRNNAPKAIPSHTMNTLWQLALSGHATKYVAPWSPGPDLYSWKDHFKCDGLTTTLRLELLEMLKPRVELSEKNRPDKKKDDCEPADIKERICCEIVLVAGEVYGPLRELKENKHWKDALPDLLPDFTRLLRDALDLKHAIDGENARRDFSYIGQPSISEYAEQKKCCGWEALICLTLDAWSAMFEKSSKRAALDVETWSTLPYPLFRRLVFFACAKKADLIDIIEPSQALDWLLEDGFLWSKESEQEVICLLVVLAPKLYEIHAETLERLEQAILDGPPDANFSDNLTQEEKLLRKDYHIWLRLKQINQNGVRMGTAAKSRWQELSEQDPKMRLAENEHKKYLMWMEPASQPLFPAQYRRRDLVKWLKENPGTDRYEEKDDGWRELCKKNFSTTACALCQLKRDGFWPTGRWRSALQAWSGEKFGKLSWRYMAPVISTAPAPELQKLARSISWWLQEISETFEGHEEIFFLLADKVLGMNHEEGSATDFPVQAAINHPVGQVTQALLFWLCRETPEDGQRLSEKLISIFGMLCNTQCDKFRHGRVLLAANVILLFRVDPDWTRTHLLALFDWQASEMEAMAAWQGFLPSSYNFLPLMNEIKPAFLETANHYKKLGDRGHQYAAVLTCVALYSEEPFTKKELVIATRALPPAGLDQVVKYLIGAQKSAGEKGNDHWDKHMKPYFRFIWPQDKEYVGKISSENIGLLCISAQERFPCALKRLKGWLQPMKHPWHVVRRLHEAGLYKQFPKEALEFLNLIISDETQWVPNELEYCLAGILEKVPDFEDHPIYKKLMTSYWSLASPSPSR